MAPVTAGGRVACPLNAPVVGAGGSFYPAGYPHESLPKPDRCFASVEDARGAGLSLADAPPGAVRIDGIYLVRAGGALRSRCRTAASRIGYPVACPGLVPSPADAVRTNVICCQSHLRQFLLEERFGAPADYRGAGTAGYGAARHSVGHLWIVTEANIIVPPETLCAGSDRQLGKVSKAPPVRGHAAQWVVCGQGAGMHSGHLLLTWNERSNLLYAVSLHGHSALNRRIALAIARRVAIVD